MSTYPSQDTDRARDGRQVADDRAYRLRIIYSRTSGGDELWLVQEPHEDGGDFLHQTLFASEADAKIYANLFCAWCAADPVKRDKLTKRLENLRALAVGRV